MPFNLSKTHRNDRELFVLKKIERFQVNEYMGRSNWARYYFDNYKDAIKKFRDLFLKLYLKKRVICLLSKSFQLFFLLVYPLAQNDDE